MKSTAVVLLVKIVAEEFAVPEKKLCLACKETNVAYARYALWWLMSLRFGMTSVAIARITEHTQSAVNHGLRCVRQWEAKERDYPSSYFARVMALVERRFAREFEANTQPAAPEAQAVTSLEASAPEPKLEATAMVLRIVSLYFHLPPDALKAKRGGSQVEASKFMAWALLHQVCGFTMARIAHETGMDRSTIRHGIGALKTWIDSDGFAENKIRSDYKSLVILVGHELSKQEVAA